MTKLENLIKQLKKANKRLKEAAGTNPTQMNKDATIQRFEFTFELAWKAIQKYVRDQGFDCKSPKNCIREAARLEVIDDPEDWFDFLKKRNLTAHTYNREIANQIYKKAIKFPKEVDALLEKISQE